MNVSVTAKNSGMFLSLVRLIGNSPESVKHKWIICEYCMAVG